MSQKLMCDKAITTLHIATKYTKLPTRDLAGNSTYLLILNCCLLVFKFFKSNEKLDWCARKRTIMIFFILIAKIWTPHYCSPHVPKRPGHLFVVKFYGRVNTIKVMSNQLVNLLGSQRRSNKHIFLNTRFQDRRIYN